MRKRFWRMQKTLRFRRKRLCAVWWQGFVSVGDSVWRHIRDGSAAVGRASECSSSESQRGVSGPLDGQLLGKFHRLSAGPRSSDAQLPTPLLLLLLKWKCGLFWELLPDICGIYNISYWKWSDIFWNDQKSLICVIILLKWLVTVE